MTQKDDGHRRNDTGEGKGVFTKLSSHEVSDFPDLKVERGGLKLQPGSLKSALFATTEMLPHTN